MNFDLGPDELALRDAVRDLCRGPLALDSTRERGVDAAQWRMLGDAGVFCLRLPEDHGGIGAGMTQAVVVFQELGRALVPGPLVATHLAARLVPDAASGDAVVGWLDAARGPMLLEHGPSLTHLLVSDAGRTMLVDPATVDVRPVPDPLDPSTPVALVVAPPRGELIEADSARMRREGLVLTAALLAGIAARCVDAAVEYAKEREQFGRPIGSFQSVKHLCADMLVRAEVARAAVDAAGVTCDDPSAGDADRAAATAALLAGDAAIANAKACIQVHGGMGFTWEVPIHLFLKRAAVLCTHFGGAAEHAESVAGCL